MSRVLDVIKNKNRVEKMMKERRREELNSMKYNTAFKARLYEELNKLNILLEHEEVESIVIEIPDMFIANFGESIYSSDLAEYAIEQLDGEPNKFRVRRKYIVY